MREAWATRDREHDWYTSFTLQRPHIFTESRLEGGE
jgi:hypothetical protein